jgi:hypothetical protein
MEDLPRPLIPLLPPPPPEPRNGADRGPAPSPCRSSWAAPQMPRSTHHTPTTHTTTLEVGQ